MKIIADCNNIGVRIDKIISGLCPSIPRTKIQEAIESGKVEKATIPSIAYLTSPQKDHLVSPATLSTFSYSSQ